jgi:protein gp37
MATRTAIEWTDVTWNPVVGCTKVSPGCDRCYAERVTRRFPTAFPGGFALRLREEAIDLPTHWRTPRRVFVNSMSDLFHADVPSLFISRVFEVMAACPQHIFQVLTKRAERLVRLAPQLPWPDHVWMGVSIEHRDFLWRLDYLRRVPAAVRFVSAEPLLDDLGATSDMTSGIDWLIAGGESQPGARPAALDWFRTLRDQCQTAGVPYFLKQLGGYPRKRGGADAVLDGQTWTEYPVARAKTTGALRAG